MLPLYLIWCIWRKRNDRSFEDRERTVAVLKAFFFNSLFQWRTTYDYFRICSFHDFSFLFKSFIFFWLDVSFVYVICTRVRPFVFKETIQVFKIVRG